MLVPPVVAFGNRFDPDHVRQNVWPAPDLNIFLVSDNIFENFNLEKNISSGQKSDILFWPKYMLKIHFSKTATQNSQNKDLNENGSLMKVESIEECSPWSILQYF